MAPKYWPISRFVQVSRVLFAAGGIFDGFHRDRGAAEGAGGVIAAPINLVRF